MSNFDFSNLSSNNNNNDDKDLLTKAKEIATIMLDNIVKYSKLTFETASPILKEKSEELADGTKNISKKMLSKYEQKQKEKKVYLKYKTINKIYDDYKDSILDLENEIKEANKQGSKVKNKVKNQEQSKDKSAIAVILLIAVIALVIIFKFLVSNLFAIILILIAFSPLFKMLTDRFVIKSNKQKLDKVAIFRPDLKRIFEKMALYINDDDLIDFIKYYQTELVNLETFLNIKLDANQIDLTEDVDDGELMLSLGNIAVNQDSKVIAETLDDVDMNRFNIIPQANYLIKGNNILILFDNWITDYLKIGKAIDIKERIELLGFSNFFENVEEVDLSRFSRKGKQIINKLRQDDVKEKLGMYVHDAFAEGITENKYFIKIRMVLQNTNKAKAKSLLNEIGLISKRPITRCIASLQSSSYTVFKQKIGEDFL